MPDSKKNPGRFCRPGFRIVFRGTNYAALRRTVLRFAAGFFPAGRPTAFLAAGLRPTTFFVVFFAVVFFAVVFFFTVFFFAAGRAVFFAAGLRVTFSFFLATLRFAGALRTVFFAVFFFAAGRAAFFVAFRILKSPLLDWPIASHGPIRHNRLTTVKCADKAVHKKRLRNALRRRSLRNLARNYSVICGSVRSVTSSNSTSKISASFGPIESLPRTPYPSSGGMKKRNLSPTLIN